MSATALAYEAAKKTPGVQVDAHQPNGLTKYIPTEVITLYIATLSTKESILATFRAIFDREFDLTYVYWFYVILTPIVFTIVYVGTIGVQKMPSLRNWPWWRTIASTIAFAVWALAVPENPYLAKVPAAAPLAALGALFVSILLTLLEPIFSSSEEVK
jgi:hypothetical protein